HGDILIQVFTSINNKEYILYLKDELLQFIPNAKIIGTTTNGEISQNGSINDSTVIAVSVFDKTQIITTIIDNQENSFNQGTQIIKDLNNKENLNLLITFTDGLNTNGEEYLNGISSINDKVIVSGGMAGDYSRFEETFVFNEKSITSNGAVAAGFYGDTLNIHTDYSFNWETVGKSHIVEKSIKNRVYQISGMTTVDFYKHYLGNDIDKLLPAIGIEFPLVLEIDGVKTARAVLTKHDDDSLSFAGNIQEGSKIQFGHGDVQLIIEKGLESIKNIIQSPIESIFIYSCMARKALLQDDINLEILPLNKIAPICGFFAYGEFYHESNCEHSNAKLLNQSMSLLAISENDKEIDKIDPNLFNEHIVDADDLTLHRTQALSCLIKRTTKELEDLNENLNIRVEEEINLNLEKDNMLTLLHTQAQLGSTLEMILHQWRQPISAITSTLTSVQVYKDAAILTDDILDQNINNVLEYTEHINTTIEDFRDLFQSTDKNTEIQIDSLITKSLTIIKPILLENRINIDINININNVISIPVGLVMQVILNIVKNAIDILNQTKTDNPIISISAYTEKEKNIIQISDNGGGIPDDILPQIFKKNFTTKKDNDGTGIGLHMSKKIIETKVKGSLKAHNDSDNKAVFTITIPN
ncbi:FIST N-terminal domain-containing protein, partial [Arcobacteraceae bacterium]|nr:FIST N-terminal domain-containing protein [Arcobacteraceae bacterium]